MEKGKLVRACTEVVFLAKPLSHIFLFVFGRLQLAVGNRLIRVIHKKHLKQFCASYLKFDEDHSNDVWKRENFRANAREGVIRVDTLDYVFKYNRDTDLMEITCPFGKNKLTTSDIGVAYSFMSDLLWLSLPSVKELELIVS